MKLLTPVSLAVALLFAVQVHGDDNPFEGLLDKYNKALEELKKSSSVLGENVKEQYGAQAAELNKKIQEGFHQAKELGKNMKEQFNAQAEGVSKTVEEGFRSYTTRRRRDTDSPTEVEEEGKQPTQQALDKLNSAFQSLKNTINNAFNNVTNSEAYNELNRNFEKFKGTLSDAGARIKSSIHNITAPTSKESEEST